MTTNKLRWVQTRFFRRQTVGNYQHPLRNFTTSGLSSEAPRVPEAAKTGKIDIDALLAKPLWSVSSLMPSQPASDDVPTVTSKQLHHLLRLSALPPSASPEEEQKMLSTLQSQLHFVREIQKVDTSGVEPLTSLRDETVEGEKEAELGLDALAEAIAAEEVRGKFHPRIRRKKGIGAVSPGESADQWDVLGCAERKVGRYFVVEGGKD